MLLSQEDKKLLLAAARGAIRSAFNKNIHTDIKLSPCLKERATAFVTLRISGELRGCIGVMNAEQTLYENVFNSAKQAAFHDPRFTPLSEVEFDNIEIEISVLSSFHKIKDYSEIELGKHGLFLEMFNFRGVLLPQVAEENNFTLPEFLTAICEKSGLPPFFWQIRKLDLHVFEAIVFSESDLNYE